jgi:hypothetical protein
VQVLDVNEAPFFASSHFEFSLSEKAVAGTFLDQVHASDVDIADRNALTYTFTGSDLFRMDQHTGELTYIGTEVLSFAETPSYHITATVVDSVGHEDTTTVEVIVQDANDPPFFVQCEDRVVPENSIVGTVFGTSLESDDIDNVEGSGVPFQELACTLEGVGDSADAVDYFEVTTGGGIRVKSALLNFEQKNSFDLKAIVRDNGPGRLAGFCQFHIDVTDVNEEPIWLFNGEEQSASSSTPVVYLAENAVEGTSIIDLNAFDNDADDACESCLAYSIVPGNHAAKFHVSEFTGLLSTAEGSTFDYESQTIYSLTLSAHDGALSTEMDVEVRVLDRNDGPYLASETSPIIRQVFENVANTAIGQVINVNPTCSRWWKTLASSSLKWVLSR